MKINKFKDQSTEMFVGSPDIPISSWFNYLVVDLDNKLIGSTS